MKKEKKANTNNYSQEVIPVDFGGTLVALKTHIAISMDSDANNPTLST